MSLKIDITMTAVLRPTVIKSTLDSFTKNLFKNKDEYRLIINIDPIGDKGVRPPEIVDLCYKYFDDVKYNIANEPSFPKAVIWTWKQIKTPFVFHLEDDWIIRRFVNINQLVRILRKNPHLACLRLYKHDIDNKSKPRLFNSPYVYKEKGHFFEAVSSKKQFGLNPVLIRKEFIDEALPLMVYTKNPEKQFRYNNEKMRNFVMRWKYAIYGDPGDKALVWGKNGLHWRNKSNYDKPRDGKQFLTWVTK